MRAFLAALTFLGLVQASVVSAENGPVVVELYTSQGCSSCPPADAMLRDLAAREDVIALALHVDYWDYIGWKDSFGRPENTQRQHAYARAAHATTVYTPQMVFNGQDHVVGSRAMQVMDALQAHLARGNSFDVALFRSGDQVSIRANAGPYGDYAVQLVRFLPEATVDIRRGENAGRTITYSNIVTAWDVVARWDGRAPLDLLVNVSGGDAIAVLVQQTGHGPILGAAQLR
jgi:hypothetical protein